MWVFLFVIDINELNLPKTCTTEFPDPDDLLNFKLIICPDEVSKSNSWLNYLKGSMKQKRWYFNCFFYIFTFKL